MEIKENHNIKSLNTFCINVDAKYFVEVASIADIREICEFTTQKNIPFLILGGGSNILFTKNFDGIVVKVNLKGIEMVKEEEDYFFIKAFAGENWDEVVQYCVDRNLGGLENLSLIPGNVGTSPIQNIGAYGVEVKDHFHELEAIDWETSDIIKFKAEDCGFGYRNSIFKNELKGKVIITSVSFRLDKNPVLKTEYGNIKAELDVIKPKELSIKTVRDAVINIRRKKLPDPDEIGNAGSFFKNPVVTEKKYRELKIAFPGLVSFHQADGNYKVAAGWLIDQCGWKGKRVGNTGVHEKQALVLVNYGDATGENILELSEKIKLSVLEKFGIELEREVNIV